MIGFFCQSDVLQFCCYIFTNFLLYCIVKFWLNGHIITNYALAILNIIAVFILVHWPYLFIVLLGMHLFPQAPDGAQMPLQHTIEK